MHPRYRHQTTIPFWFPLREQLFKAQPRKRLFPLLLKAQKKKMMWHIHLTSVGGFQKMFSGCPRALIIHVILCMYVTTTLLHCSLMEGQNSGRMVCHCLHTSEEDVDHMAQNHSSDLERQVVPSNWSTIESSVYLFHKHTNVRL